MANQRGTIVRQLGWMAGVYVFSVLAMVAFSYAGRWLVKCILNAMQVLS
jgi:hypothetical protein